MMDYHTLSKIISHALRHKPEEYGITLDNGGWVNLIDLVNAIRRRVDKFDNLTLQDIYTVVGKFEKRRHEIDDYRIRAINGHSTKIDIKYLACMPPVVLYHGTSKGNIQSIFVNGLTRMGRLYVHLSTEPETAVAVGKRKDDAPVLLKISSLIAFNDGIEFYFANDAIWLANHIPTTYIELI